MEKLVDIVEIVRYKLSNVHTISDMITMKNKDGSLEACLKVLIS